MFKGTQVPKETKRQARHIFKGESGHGKQTTTFFCLLPVRKTVNVMRSQGHPKPCLGARGPTQYCGEKRNGQICSARHRTQGLNMQGTAPHPESLLLTADWTRKACSNKKKKKKKAQEAESMSCMQRPEFNASDRLVPKPVEDMLNTQL